MKKKGDECYLKINSLFCSRQKLWSMKSLYIKNYKNLRELSIDSLARVNLIVGCNNVGKSTLLEAVSIYLANGNDEWLKTIWISEGKW